MVVINVSDPNDVYKNNEFTVVHFYADWSEECKNIDKVFDVLSSQSEYSNVSFKKCAAENFPDVSLKYNVTAVPTVLFFKNGTKVDELIGADPALLNKKLQQFNEIDSKKHSDQNNGSILNSIICSDTIVACIKDDKATSESKLNEELISILNDNKAKYRVYDVLTDISIKEKLETFSESTVFPQLYIKGKFVGDIQTIRNLNSGGALSAWFIAAAKNLDPNVVQKLLSLINKSNIMIFMKGDPNSPRCGFSRQLIKILTEIGLPYDTFDILTDEDVRQGLKVFSDWPTYPQVYVKGELVGGIDIINSLKNDGELMETLQR